MSAGEPVEEFAVPALLSGMRLDRAVAMLTGVARSVAADLVTSGRVRVDGAVVTQRSLPLSGSSLAVVRPRAADHALEAEADVAFDVVYADDQVVVVDKPAGLVVHPGAGRQTGTLVSGLLARYPDLAQTDGGWEADRPGIVHRLDRGTSGLLVVARTAGAYRSLVGQLAARSVSRRYLALVAGHPAEDRGVVEAPIGRSARTPTRMAVSAQGREARTRYRVLQRRQDPLVSSLLELSLETGRTHQIRVHLAAIGHPVVGDDRYGGRGRVGGSVLAPGRLFLHAADLGFEHPTSGEELHFSSGLPADLAAVVPGAPEGGAGGQAAR